MKSVYSVLKLSLVIGAVVISGLTQVSAQESQSYNDKDYDYNNPDNAITITGSVPVGFSVSFVTYDVATKDSLRCQKLRSKDKYVPFIPNIVRTPKSRLSQVTQATMSADGRRYHLTVLPEKQNRIEDSCQYTPAGVYLYITPNTTSAIPQLVAPLGIILFSKNKYDHSNNSASNYPTDDVLARKISCGNDWFTDARYSCGAFTLSGRQESNIGYRENIVDISLR